MRKLIRRIFYRASRGLGVWLTNEKNLPRLKAVRAFFNAAMGDSPASRAAMLRYPHLMRDSGTAARLRIHEEKIYSQFGEDGLILFLLDRIGAPNKTFVEIGVEDGRECNTANLSLNFGWSGLLLDGSENSVRKARNFYYQRKAIGSDRVQIHSHFVTRENADDLLRRYGCDRDLDVLSIDIDGVDYWVWDAISCVEPRLVVMEYNAVFGRERSLTVPYAADFDRYERHESGLYFGASLSALTKLADRKGYLLAGCESSGANAFFVRRDLAVGKIEPFTPAEAFYPNAPTIRLLTEEQQWETVKDLPLTEV